MNQPKNASPIFKDKKSRMILIALVSALLFMIIFSFWQSEKFDQEIALKTQFIEEKNALRDDLDDLIDEHELLKDEYGEISDQLLEKDSAISAYAKEIKSLLRSDAELKVAKLKIKKLKEISQKYISAIDSLFTINQQLQIQNDSVIRMNRLISRRNRALENDNRSLVNRVESASILKMTDIVIDGLYYRASGREVSTSRAHKIQNFRLCYKVLENKVAQPGLKNIYLRILSPKGEVLTVANKVQTFEAADTTYLFTTNFQIDYQNVNLSDCFLWTRGNPLDPGVYVFEFFSDKELIGLYERKFR